MFLIFVFYFDQLGQLDQVTGGASDSETREVLIKNHFSKRINEMMLQHQQLDSKCVAFHSEVRVKYYLLIRSKSNAICPDQGQMSSNQNNVKCHLIRNMLVHTFSVVT